MLNTRLHNPGNALLAVHASTENDILEACRQLLRNGRFCSLVANSISERFPLRREEVAMLVGISAGQDARWPAER